MKRILYTIALAVAFSSCTKEREPEPGKCWSLYQQARDFQMQADVKQKELTVAIAQAVVRRDYLEKNAITFDSDSTWLANHPDGMLQGTEDFDITLQHLEGEVTLIRYELIQLNTRYKELRNEYTSCGCKDDN